MRFAQFVVIDFAWRHWLPERPFLAARSSRNWPVRLGRRFAVDPLPALLAESDDATQSRWQRGVPLFPYEQTQPNLRKPAHPEPCGVLLEAPDHPPSWPRQIEFVRQHPGLLAPPVPGQSKQAVRLHIDQEPCGKAALCFRMRHKGLAD